MSRILRPFLLAIACLLVTGSIFDFLKSSGSAGTTTTVHVPNPINTEYDHYRGIAPHEREKYSKDTFICDNGVTVLSASSVNDGFCDCQDHSDEPGTSACSKGTFYCVNKGYKPMSFPSSRVDDQVCDCCDGSDEGIYVKCPNTCQEMAELEKSAMTRLIQSYKVGSHLRQMWEDSAREKLQREANPPADNKVELEKVRAELAEVNNQISTKESVIAVKETEKKMELKSKLNRLLKLSVEDLSYSASFLANLVDALQMDEMQLVNHLSEPHSVTPRHTATSTDGDHYEDDYGLPPDPAKAHEEKEEAATKEDSTAESCDLTEMTGNPLLRVLCDASDKPSAVLAMIHSIIQEMHPYNQLMLITGYSRLHQSLSGAGAFVRNHLINFGNEACPGEFESLPNICETKELIKDIVEHMGKIVLEEENSELLQFKQRRNDLQNRIHDLENTETTAIRAREQLEQYATTMAFLFQKGQVIEVNDGKFSYAITMLESVRQKELEGGQNTVTLGDFSSIEESTDHGHSYKMKFANGQYCHAFGARSAEVTVICGERNVLKSAQEPSTCFYSLLLESPAACTEKYAMANGLLA